MRFSVTGPTHRVTGCIFDIYVAIESSSRDSSLETHAALTLVAPSHSNALPNLNILSAEWRVVYSCSIFVAYRDRVLRRKIRHRRDCNG